ncbi:MAG: DegT/DnrJ/EryC1/StrS family aminotransferase [Bdellovibrio sp.]
MDRFSSKEKEYVLEVLDNSFRNSKNSIFNSRLEKKFAEIFKSNFAIGIMNGTCTMHAALHALGVLPGDEVIVPPLTMSAPALAVLHNGSIPVFADVDPQTFTISAESIKKCITKKTKAVITVSLYGLAPDYDAILKVCKEHQLPLIEDNAECFLGKYKGKLVGEYGDFSSYSFQASKHMTSGEGGMLTTNNEQWADKVRKFTSLGYAGVSSKQGKISRLDIQDPAYSRHVTLGFNFRMSELQAACALGQLERLEELVNARIRSAEIFDKVVLNSGILRRQEQPPEYVNSYWAYACVLETTNPEKDWYIFRDIFQKNGGDGYYAAWKLSYMEPLFQGEIAAMPGVWQKYQAGLCPQAEYLQSRMIQFKTDYWDEAEAVKQAEILKKTIAEFKSR